MSRLWCSACLVAALVLFTSVGWADEPVQTIYKGPEKARLDALAKSQPGLGSLMAEFGNRFVDVYYAAKGQNWGLASYQLGEMVEIVERVEKTVPDKAPMLTSFEHEKIDALKKVLFEKNWGKFHAAFKQMAEGCNNCHEATNHPYIHFKLPSRPVESYLDFNRKTEPEEEHDED